MRADHVKPTSSFLFLSDDGFGKNIIIFGVNSFSLYAHSGKKDILIVGKEPTDGLDDTRITGEAKSCITFREIRNEFCLTLHYNRSNSFLFLNKVIIYQFKSKDFEINAYSLCLGNALEDFTVD